MRAIAKRQFTNTKTSSLLAEYFVVRKIEMLFELGVHVCVCVCMFVRAAFRHGNVVVRLCNDFEISR